MKYLLIPLILLIGCSNESPFREKPIVNGENLTELSEACTKLAKCIGGIASIVHFKNQRSNPFACEINKTKLDGIYFYPDLDPVDKEPGFGRFRQAIDACELVTQTGHHSPKYLEDRRRSDELAFKEMDAERKKREKDKLKHDILPKLLPIKEY